MNESTSGRVRSLILTGCGHDFYVYSDAPLTREQRNAERAKTCPLCYPEVYAPARKDQP